MKKIVLIVFVLLLIVSVVGLCACSENTVVAHAEEETNSSPYYNFTIKFRNAPLHFVYPLKAYGNDAIESSTDYFRNEIVDTKFLGLGDTSTQSSFVDMIYILQDKLGNVYAKSVVRVGTTAFFPLNPENNTFNTSFNNIAFVRNGALLTKSTVPFVENDIWTLYRPQLVLTEFDVTRSFTVKLSYQGNLNLNDFVVRACSLYDYLLYGDRSEIYYNYLISDSTSPGNLIISDFTFTTSSLPENPVNYTYEFAFNHGYSVGYSQGYEYGDTNGYNRGYSLGYQSGYSSGETTGYNVGFESGRAEGILSANDYSFMSLVSAVFDAPIRILTDTLNVEILGYNMSSFFWSILTVCLIFGIIKFFI